jgi:hypothetical protein
MTDSVKLNHISYAISFDDLVGTWIDIYHRDSHVIVIYDPINHMELLTNIGLAKDPEFYKSKILISEVDSIDHALIISRMLSSPTGPYIQVWSLGHYIRDNLDK